MNAYAIREGGAMARSVAIWGSLAAAVTFGVGFLTDRALSSHLVFGQAEQIALVLLVFAGYWLAWSRRYEVIGSVLALAAVAAYWLWCRLQNPGSPQYIFLAVAAPAVFHLVAVGLLKLAKVQDLFRRRQSPANGAPPADPQATVQ